MDYREFNQIIENGLKKSDDHSVIMGQLVKAGLPFDEVTAYFNQIGVDKGLLLSASEKREQVLVLLSDLEKGAVLDYVKYKALELSVQKKCDFDISIIIKGLYKKITGFEIPKRSNNILAGSYRVLADWLLENPHATDEEIKSAKLKLIGKNGQQDNQMIKFKNFFLNEFKKGEK